MKIETQSPLQLQDQWEAEGILYIKVGFALPASATPQPMAVHFSVPSVDLHSHWSPQTDPMRKLGPNWNKKTTQSRFAHGLPLHAVLSADGQNRLTVAVSDVKTNLTVATGISEERAELDCKITFFTQLTAPIAQYSAVLRIDRRDIPFYEAISQGAAWLDRDPAPVPEAAKAPVNSLWYSFHQDLNSEEILEECRLSRPYGLETVILDDGWQTEDNNRGYAYCGDWELATAKIPDMRKLSDGIHSLGMKLMLWYSVPYMGIHSKNYSRFGGKYLYFDQRRGVGALDPRYPEVRAYLADQYETAVTQWDLDGLKLDFVNAFKLTPETPTDDPARDICSLEEAIEALLQEVMTRLHRCKPDLLVEFRQGYIGPALRRYGNMLRAGDCPNDWLCNKTAVLDLRLTSGKTPVHSDMLMWHPEEPAQIAALQLAAVLFAVPQISVRLAKISPEQQKMLGFYLDFWRKNRDTLLEGRLKLWDPQALYSKASVTRGGQTVAILYTDTTFCRETDSTTLINCGKTRKLYLDGFGGCAYRILDCMGNHLAAGTLEALTALSVPTAGMVEIGGTR